jgi:Bifunctional DNA primase/polymerase, N-terminal
MKRPITKLLQWRLAQGWTQDEVAALTGLSKAYTTFISTSRDDGVSGIRFFTVPEGLRWRGKLGNSIEIIQRKHRYAVVAPSLHPDTGNRYRWLDAEWRPVRPPAVAELPAMPAAWVEYLTGGEVDTGPAPRKATVTPLDTHMLLTPGNPCRAMAKQLDEYPLRKSRMARYDAMIATQQALVRFGEQGHQGAAEAIEQLRGQYMADVAGERPAASAGEFQRGLTGAVAKALGSPTAEADRRCCGPTAPPVVLLEGTPPPAPTPSSELILPADFYEARTKLRQIREYAHSRGAPADPVLYDTLARILGWCHTGAD